jgi:glycosyltransferase involved in cell wall biosynthesis
MPWAHPTLSRWYLELSTRWAARRATRLLAISQATANDLRTLYSVPAERIDVVYEGVDPGFRPCRERDAQAALRARYSLGDGPYLLAVGTLQPRKNLHGLLRAYRLLCDRRPDVPGLVLAGRPGWGEAALETTLARLGLRDRVKRPGFVAEHDLPALYSGALLYLQPSLYEGFGLTVLEAMACGTAVIASNSSSLPEVVGGAGLLVDATQPRTLADAIDQLLDSPIRRAELAAAGRRRSASFTWERCARGTLASLRRAA